MTGSRNDSAKEFHEIILNRRSFGRCYAVKMHLLYLCFVLLLFNEGVNCRRFHRLQLPSANSELQIVPRIEVPMSMAPTVQTGMNIRLPISLKFPTKEDSFSFYRQNSKHLTTDLFLNETRVEGRARFYRIIQDSHPSLGKECLMRSICEVAQVPLMNPATGLFGEVIDLLLT